MFNSISRMPQTISQAATVLNGRSFARSGGEAEVCIERIPLRDRSPHVDQSSAKLNIFLPRLL
jgi:hypothetical protein